MNKNYEKLTSYLFHSKQTTPNGESYIVSPTILRELSKILLSTSDNRFLRTFADCAESMPGDLFAIWLKTGRKILLITQEELSRSTGVAQGDISLLERNKKKKIGNYDIEIGEVQKRRISKFIKAKLDERI